MAWIICKYGSGGGGDTRPDGSTVTPVSDVSIWLRCGGLGSKGYTTLSQVLADADTLDGLMSDANAVNYLVRSTSWVSDITSNSSAMTYIGANDYAAYKLLYNDSWETAIYNSSYWSSVLTDHVPTMTSATTPSGKASCTNLTPYQGNNPWMAFDKNSSTLFMPTGYNIDGYLTYEFDHINRIVKAKIENQVVQVWSIQGSNDGTNWSFVWGDDTSLKIYNTGVTTDYVDLSDNKNTYKYYRLHIKVGSQGAYARVYELDFYGRSFGDVQSWLKAGKITDKTYTTLEQVLSDASTLQALMASSDAVDYLSACSNWASTICSNQSAMNYIGLNNYAANALLSDITWLNAIVNSAYMNSVLNIKVPTMTSDTTPSGKCSCSHGNAQTWQAFDGNDSTRMNLVSSSINYEWVEYEFETPLSVRKIKDLIYGTINTRVSSAKLQCSSDRNTWNDIQTFSDYKNSSSHEYAINTSQIAKYWRIYISFNTSDYISYHTIQLYGRQNV